MAITDEIPRSRITLTYRTRVHGEPEEVTLPFRVLVMGDLSNGTSKDRELELDKRQIRRLDGKNLNEMMKDMRMSLTFSVPNRINPKTGGEEMEITLPVTSTKSFLPAEVAKGVPRIKALLLLKKLLLEAQANFDNRKEFRSLLRLAAEDPATIDALAKEMPAFDVYKLPGAQLKVTVPDDVAKLPGLEIRSAQLVPDPAAKPGSDGKVPKVKRDEQLLDKGQYNVATRVKAGEYEIRAFAPGKKPWSGTIVAEHDTTVEIAVPALVDAG